MQLSSSGTWLPTRLYLSASPVAMRGTITKFAPRVCKGKRVLLGLNGPAFLFVHFVLNLSVGAPGWRSRLSVRLQPGHDLAVREFEPRVRLWADGSEPGACFRFCVSLSLCPSPVHALSLSVPKINKNVEKKLKKKKSLLVEGKRKLLICTVLGTLTHGNSFCTCIRVQKLLLGLQFEVGKIDLLRICVGMEARCELRAPVPSSADGGPPSAGTAS